MAPKKSTASRKLNLQKSQELSSANSSDLGGNLTQALDDLASAQSKIAALMLEVEQANLKQAESAILLDKAQDKIKHLESEVKSAQEKQKDTYRSLRNERRTRQRAVKRKEVLDDKVAELQRDQIEKIKEMKELQKKDGLTSQQVNNVMEANRHLQNELSNMMTTFSAELELTRQNLKLTKKELKGSKAEIYNLKRKSVRAAQTRENVIKKTKAKITKERTTLYLLNKGVYSQETRNLVRILVQANVSNQNIMHVIESVLAAAGITAVGRITPRSVSRIIKEGYIAACIQLGYEMQAAEALTLSSDGTGHKNLNYNSRHANYKVEGADGQKIQVTRFLGLQRSLDGSSEEAVKDWDYQLQNFFDIFNASPLAKKTNTFARLLEIYHKLAGMHSDHCAMEKKNFVLMGEKKIEATHQILGEKRLLDDSVDDLMPHFVAANQSMIEDIGGQDAWDGLTELQKNEHKSQMLIELTTNLGKDSFEKLSDREKALFKLFIWVGCGCHKDLNTVLGGYIGLSKFWIENKLEQPVLLPNKVNAAVIKDKTAGDSESAKQAVLNSSRGAIKAAKLAGDILNNKDDKKGHHDQFRIWWKEKVGVDFTFPKTSNNRFQSNCEAAAVLTVYRDQVLQYLQYAESKKTKMRYSHMEKNLVKALNDIPTRTELAVLALYGQAVSHPYMKAIREDPTANALDLGPLNKKIESFIVRITEDPTFLVGNNVSYETGSFDGQPWRSKVVVETINKLAPEFPHLKPALVAFFKGALESWKRFTSEYSPGGLIDEATQEERDLAWMPTTNDVNEGALGQFRVMIRRHPQLTLLQYNARTMFARNNTAAFMDAMFTEDTHKYVRELARQQDTSEKDRLKDILAHNEKNIAKKMANKKKREQRAIAAATRISKVVLNFKKEEIEQMKGEALREQFEAFKKAGALMPSNVKKSSKVGELKEALKGIIDSFKKGEWQLESSYETPKNIQEDEEEYFEGYHDISDEDSEEEEEEDNHN